jgi:hypothetical protein
MLYKYPSDLKAIRDIIARAIVIYPHAPSEIAVENINSTYFKFDQHTMEKLQSIDDYGLLINELKRLMSSNVTVGESPAAEAQKNIYLTCSEEVDSTNCSGGKLIVPESRINDLYDILASDIRNKSKTNVISAISSGVFDPLNFIRRPGEHLVINLGM